MTPTSGSDHPEATGPTGFDDKVHFFLLGSLLQLNTAAAVLEAAKAGELMNRVNLELIDDIATLTVKLLEVGIIHEARAAVSTNT